MTKSHLEILKRFASLQNALQNADNQYGCGSKQMAIAHLRTVKAKSMELINYLSHAHEIEYLNEQGKENEAQHLIEEGIKYA